MHDDSFKSSSRFHESTATEGIVHQNLKGFIWGDWSSISGLQWVEIWLPSIDNERQYTQQLDKAP